MKLSFKQMAVLGQVKVNIRPIDCALKDYVSLLDLYKQGYWITQRFGTIITLVKPRANLKDGFSCTCKRIKTTVSFETLDECIEQINDRQYRKYKDYLESRKGWSTRLRYKDKEETDEDTMPALQPDDRSGD